MDPVGDHRDPYGGYTTKHRARGIIWPQKRTDRQKGNTSEGTSGIRWQHCDNTLLISRRDELLVNACHH